MDKNYDVYDRDNGSALEMSDPIDGGAIANEGAIVPRASEILELVSIL